LRRAGAVATFLLTMEPLPPTSPWRAWSWVPSLYFCQAVPYVAVVALSVPMYKKLGVSNADLAFWTSWLYLPWVIKPLWSPLVDRFRTKRAWIWSLQFLVGAGLAAVALAVPGPDFFRWTLAVFWLLAFASATHDIAADGFYLLALPAHQQAAFVGVRSLFFRLGNLAGQGGLVYLAGHLEETTGNLRSAWAWVFVPPAILFALAASYHFLALPRPAGDAPAPAKSGVMADWLEVLASFFRKPDIGAILAFLLLYRLGEAQLLKLVQPFLLDDRAQGGLGLTTKQLGVVYNTHGVIALIAGGLLGGWMISRHGLKRMLWPMLATMHLPNLAYVWLAVAQPAAPVLVSVAVVVEQFGYGFGFTAYMVFMMSVADGPHKTAHYALCTGFMALGMMLPGMASGWIEELVGYRWFFAWVCVACLPSVLATGALKVDPAFGRKAVPAAPG
jgi:MFS transporter, PAT family, beta-lactamase induction signal transducer AmpG